MAASELDPISALRVHIVRLIRAWTAMSLVRRVRNHELCSALTDVCSDHLRNMLHELANKKTWTLGFAPDGSVKHKRLFQRLLDANKWFEGGNGLHYRNCSGSHLQPMDKAQHMFQQFGYGGDREWKRLTAGVAACVQMMKLAEGGRHSKFWRDVRQRVVSGKLETFNGLSIPSAAEALLLDYKVTCE